MSYNSERDELFIADYANKVVRAMHLRENAGDLSDVYKATSGELLSVCHMSDSDTLLVCSYEKVPDQQRANWLVALIREDNEWREAKRMEIEGDGWICCALSDSRVLIGQMDSTFIELFRVESGLRFATNRRNDGREKHFWYSETCESDTLVAWAELH